MTGMPRARTVHAGRALDMSAVRCYLAVLLTLNVPPVPAIVADFVNNTPLYPCRKPPWPYLKWWRWWKKWRWCLKKGRWWLNRWCRYPSCGSETCAPTLC